MKNSNEIKVSACITAYNNEQYIEQAVKSVLNQKVNFKFEILINDDASTDNTVNVIRKLQSQFPGIITLFTHQENEFKRGMFDIYERNLFVNTKGQYITMLDGDDYWSDLNKMQLQADFLDRNPDYSLVSNQTMMYFEHDKSLRPLVNKQFPKELSHNHILNHGSNFFPTCSVMFRNVVNKYPEFMNCMSLDRKITYLMMLYGKLGYIDKAMSVYRRYDNSVTSLGNVETKIKLLKSNILLLERFDIYTHKKYQSGVKAELSLQAKNLLYFSNNKEDKNYSKYLSLKDRLKVILYRMLKK